MDGWIKLHRQLKEHWLWKSERRLKWWLDILITVNHSDSKVLIKGTLIECKRGQSIRSLESWAKEWNVTKGAVRDFFKLLESDQMLTTESLQFTTRITVSKYDDYQSEVNDKETLRKRKGNAEETLRVPKQECKEGIKNEKNEKNEDSLPDKPADIIDQIVDCFVQEHGSYEIVVRGKEREMAGKILALYKKKYPDANTEEALSGLRIFFNQCVHINDDWLRTNMSLSTIVTRFNPINKILKNGAVKQNSGATTDQIASLMARKYGADSAERN